MVLQCGNMFGVQLPLCFMMRRQDIASMLRALAQQKLKSMQVLAVHVAELPIACRLLQVFDRAYANCMVYTQQLRSPTRSFRRAIVALHGQSSQRHRRNTDNDDHHVQTPLVATMRFGGDKEPSRHSASE